MGSELHEIGEAMLATLRENSHISVFNIWFRDLIIENIQGNSVRVDQNTSLVKKLHHTLHAPKRPLLRRAVNQRANPALPVRMPT